MSNEIISKFMGECRHNFEGKYCYPIVCNICGHRFLQPHEIEEHNRYTDYENDPGAWTPEVYQKIEDAGLTAEFQYWLYTLLKSESEITCVKHSLVIGSAMMWYLLKSTPAQKDEALSRALEEVGE